MRNIALGKFRKFLEHNGLNHIRDTGGHEIWARADLRRPVVLQSHIHPVPTFIVATILRTIGSTRQELVDFLES